MAAMSSDSDLEEVPQQPATPSAEAPGGRRPPLPGGAPGASLWCRAPSHSATTAATSVHAAGRVRSGTPETVAAGGADRVARVTPEALQSALQAAMQHHASNQGARNHHQQQQQQEEDAERHVQLRQPGRLQDAQQAVVPRPAGGMEEWPESPPLKRKLEPPAADQLPGSTASATKRRRAAPPKRPGVTNTASQQAVSHFCMLCSDDRDHSGQSC